MTRRNTDAADDPEAIQQRHAADAKNAREKPDSDAAKDRNEKIQRQTDVS